MPSQPSSPNHWQLSAQLLDTACARRGVTRPAPPGFQTLIDALTTGEHPSLAASALDCLQGKPDYALLVAASVAARLASDPRLSAVLGHTYTAAQLYRLQRDQPAVDLLALLHQATIDRNGLQKNQLTELLPPEPSPPSALVNVQSPITVISAPRPRSAAVPGKLMNDAQPARRPQPAQVVAPHPLQIQPKMHVYRSKAALCVEWGSGSDTPVLFVQVARRAGASEQIDWSHRISVAVSASESFDLLQVCLGRSDFAELRFHGPHRNKSVELKKNADLSNKFALLIRVREAGSGAILGLTGFDVASLVQLLSLSVASKLPVPVDAHAASTLAQTTGQRPMRPADAPHIQ